MAMLEDALERLLRKHDVDKRVDAYLVDKGILMLIKFSALADTKADVGDGICVPAGLSKEDRPLCGPVKSAWREAEAMTEARLQHTKMGQMSDLDAPCCSVRCGSILLTAKVRSSVSFEGHHAP